MGSDRGIGPSIAGPAEASGPIMGSDRGIGLSITGPVEPKRELTPGLGRSITGSDLMFPKAWGKRSPDLPSHTQLIAENAELKARLEFADAKVRALTILASKNDHALWLLGESFGNLMGSYTSITDGVDQAVEELRNEFPSLESLVTEHEDRGNLRETAKMANWISRDAEEHAKVEYERHIGSEVQMEVYGAAMKRYKDGTEKVAL